MTHCAFTFVPQCNLASFKILGYLHRPLQHTPPRFIPTCSPRCHPRQTTPQPVSSLHSPVSLPWAIAGPDFLWTHLTPLSLLNQFLSPISQSQSALGSLPVNIGYYIAVAQTPHRKAPAGQGTRITRTRNSLLCGDGANHHTTVQHSKSVLKYHNGISFKLHYNYNLKHVYLSCLQCYSTEELFFTDEFGRLQKCRIP